MSITAPDPARRLVLLNELQDRHGAQVFGQIVQKLLAETFRRAGYAVINNAIGVPDFIATKGSPPSGYAVEAKTGNVVILSDRELRSVCAFGFTPLVAILLFPDLEPRWRFLNARSLRPGANDIHRMARRPTVVVDFDCDALFASTLAQLHAAALEGSRALDQAIAGERP